MGTHWLRAGRGRTQLQEKSEGKAKEAEGMRQDELNTRLFVLPPRTGADLGKLQEGLGWFWGVQCPWDVESYALWALRAA